MLVLLDLKLKLRTCFGKNTLFGKYGSITYVYSLKQWACRKDIDKNLFILKNRAHNDFIFESNFQLIE